MKWEIVNVLSIYENLKSRIEISRVKKLGITLPNTPGGWSIGYDDILVLDKEIERFLQRESIHVLEFGSGISTYSIASRLERSFKGRYCFYSFESDMEWYQKTYEGIENLFPGMDAVKVIKTSYVNFENGDFNFDLEWCLSILEQKLFDVIFVDAPPDTNGEDVRLNLCLRLISLLSPKGVLILHDTNRINEMYAASMLRKFFLVSDTYETQKGITVFRLPRASV